MTKAKISFILGVVLGGTLFGGAVSAQTFTAFDLASPAPGNEQFGGTLGIEFTVNSPILVTSLGAFDAASANGSAHTLNGSLITTIYNSATQLAVPGLTSTFSASDPGTLQGGYLYKTVGGINGILLNPGNYVVAWTTTTNTDQDANSNFANFIPATISTGGGLITVNTSSYRYNEATPGNFGQDKYPTSSFSGRIDAGTFKFSAVTPEPGTVSLFAGLLVAGSSAMIRRRRARKSA